MWCSFIHVLTDRCIQWFNGYFSSESELAVHRLGIFCWLHYSRLQCFLPSVLWHCWLGVRKSIQHVKKLSDEVLAWLSVCSEMVMICIWSSWCHCHPIISCFVKIQIGLTFLLPTYPGCPGKEAVKRVSVCIVVGRGFWQQTCDSVTTPRCTEDHSVVGHVDRLCVRQATHDDVQGGESSSEKSQRSLGNDRVWLHLPQLLWAQTDQGLR